MNAILLGSAVNDCVLSGDGGAMTNVCLCSGEAEPLVNDCCASGDAGGDLIGRSEMGEGGTKGKDSNIESARVDVAESTEEFEILRLSSP